MGGTYHFFLEGGSFSVLGCDGDNSYPTWSALRALSLPRWSLGLHADLWSRALASLPAPQALEAALSLILHGLVP